MGLLGPLIWAPGPCPSLHQYWMSSVTAQNCRTQPIVFPVLCQSSLLPFRVTAARTDLGESKDPAVSRSQGSSQVCELQGSGREYEPGQGWAQLTTLKILHIWCVVSICPIAPGSTNVKIRI